MEPNVDYKVTAFINCSQKFMGALRLKEATAQTASFHT